MPEGNIPDNLRGIEIPSVYLGEASLGPDNLADLCERFPGEEETFNLVMSIFNN